MEELFAQTRQAAQAKLYFLALAGALIIPDICGALDGADGNASVARYIAWFNHHVAPKYPPMTGAPPLDGRTCYQLRSSLLHQGTSQHRASRYGRIIFTEPGQLRMHNVVFADDAPGDVLCIDIEAFVEDVVTSALNWLRTAPSDPTFQARCDRFLRRYPQGLAPYVVGYPVIS